ncbi:hypothetical protein [Vampirovibrio chlorellavorus]|uniref:hypothetical protein n=1 Tax=Vampirovibrio chlorellavorus TaxID=758823 RepID=UPI0026EDA1C3|nr:hypothetical protein [Vampirovibrio chlorellavorus]
MIIPSQLSRATYLLSSTGEQRRLQFGHAPRPQPKDTREWLKTFALDLFMPHKVIPNKPDPEAPPHPLADKNVLQKVGLWFQALVAGFFKDIKHMWEQCRPAPKPR